MAVTIINIQAGKAVQRQRITLDGSVYNLRFQWMGRLNSWYMSIYDENGDPIQTSIRIVPGYQLLWRLRDSRRPPGDFYAFGMQGGSTLGLYEFGVTAPLYYITRDDIEANKAPPDPEDILTVTP